MKKICVAVLAVTILLSGCGQAQSVNLDNYVTKEEYDKVVEEKDSYKSDSESLDYFADIDNTTVFESDSGNNKVLNIVCYIKAFSDNNEISKTASKIGDKLNGLQNQEWFDYDYIMLDFWSESFGRIGSITIDGDDLSKPMQMYNWYGETNTSKNDMPEDNGIESKSDSSKIIYQDDNVIISYTGITGKETNYDVNFVIENLSNKTLEVQVRETSINGYMVNPMCSITIAPGKKSTDGMTIWSDDAENHPMSSVENIETKFHIYNDEDWNDRYDTENIIILDKE